MKALGTDINRYESESSNSPELSVVIPVYNEQENVGNLYQRLKKVMPAISNSYELIFVNDGSRDNTSMILDELCQKDVYMAALHLSRNFGHQAAVTAGLDHARGKCVVVMDGDLQDPPEVLPIFVDKWKEGYEVVYAVRQRRKEGLGKRFAYFAFYRVLASISEIVIPLDSGDFCLMDRKVVDALVALPERVRFIRGLRSFVGFRQIGVEYERAAREAGQPKYKFRQLVRLAVDGLVSFSSYPLRLVIYFSMISIVIALLLGCWVVLDALVNLTAPRGWASIIVVVLFMSSVQLLSLGIIGEYLRLIFLEVKRRPTYIVGYYNRSQINLYQ